ncbi:hypothetical protein BV22DRAFT_1200066 [Leucogyrophana mollusca]|uniref:Uncharacterized protein n=1 Tax=Leucogyrophana mollusca TaxID=85980 RepID=A0ACB8AXT6_9AGAM|nr:hypothetical protein BV22DRAFT_1200066 [Leucogyrophana mollusca]
MKYVSNPPPDEAPTGEPAGGDPEDDSPGAFHFPFDERAGQRLDAVKPHLRYYPPTAVAHERYEALCAPVHQGRAHFPSANVRVTASVLPLRQVLLLHSNLPHPAPSTHPPLQPHAHFAPGEPVGPGEAVAKGTYLATLAKIGLATSMKQTDPTTSAKEGEGAKKGLVSIYADGSPHDGDDRPISTLERVTERRRLKREGKQRAERDAMPTADAGTLLMSTQE